MLKTSVQAIKDSPIAIVVAACVAAAGVTWTVSDNVRVAPLKEQLALVEKRRDELDQRMRAAVNPAAPAITDFNLVATDVDGERQFAQNIFFRDAEGDAFIASFVVTASDAGELSARTFMITASKEQQQSGAKVTGIWHCRGRYYVKLRVVLADRAGNVSRPADHTINCREPRAAAAQPASPQGAR